MPPIEIDKFWTCIPPYQTIAAKPNELINKTVGKKSADNQAARYPALYISLVSSPNSFKFSSSRPKALITRTPVIFSLYAPVIFELIFLTLRYCTIIFLLKIESFNGDDAFTLEGLIEKFEDLEIDTITEIMEIYDDHKFKVNDVNEIECDCGHKMKFEFDELPGFFPDSWFKFE